MLRGRVSQVGIEARTVAEYIRQPFVDGQTRRIARLAQQAADALPAGPSPVATGVIVVDVPKGPANLVVLAEPAGLVPHKAQTSRWNRRIRFTCAMESEYL